MSSISTLSDADLSLWIAAKIEPKPTKRGMYVETSAWRWLWFSTEQVQSQGPSEVWTTTGEWVPRDMVGDPAMTLMLMTQQPNFICVVQSPDEPGQFSATFFAHPSRWCTGLGRAVAEAFALANGWKP